MCQILQFSDTRSLQWRYKTLPLCPSRTNQKPRMRTSLSCQIRVAQSLEMTQLGHFLLFALKKHSSGVPCLLVQKRCKSKQISVCYRASEHFRYRYRNEYRWRNETESRQWVAKRLERSRLKWVLLTSNALVLSKMPGSHFCVVYL